MYFIQRMYSICSIQFFYVISFYCRLNDCDLTDKSCSSLAKALESDNNLEELNMSNNNLQSSGVMKLCSGLKSEKCKLEILR